MIIPALHTKRTSNIELNDIFSDEAIVTAKEPSEQRGAVGFMDNIASDKVVLISLNEDRQSVCAEYNERRHQINLRSRESVSTFFSQFCRVLLDITSLRHYVWAPLVKHLFESDVHTRVMYAEPKEYSKHPSPSSDNKFDLTNKFEGLSPIPGFAKLDRDYSGEVDVFIAMLGFEGNRPRMLLNELEPAPKVIPIIGMAGFKLEYPSFTITCNRSLLEEEDAFSDIRLARASCPFEAFEQIRQISLDYRGSYLYLAPVGTKPHALGAVMFHILNPENSELLYDNPIGKSDRTKGKGKVHIYDLSKFKKND